MDYEHHDMILHTTSSPRKQTSGFIIVQLVKSLARKSFSLLIKQVKRDGERTEHCASSGVAKARGPCSAFGDKSKTKRDTPTSRGLVMQIFDLIALHWLGVQAHKRPWVSRGWVRTYC
jgi:hypothetical protein